METYRIWFTIEGFVDVEAESEDEARDEFYSMGDNELMRNTLGGAKLDDIRIQ